MDKVGKYLILGKLGQGGMGVVYRALDPLLERAVALKTISAHLDSQPELRARFFREGRSAAHLSHRNIITIYDIGEDNGVAYLAMEYLEGQDLKAKIAHRVRFSLQKKLSIIIDVCQGLSHAHSRQVIHRDIKPANIFMLNTGDIKILDFGLARMISADITRTGAPLGTPNYMSPEQVRGERVDHRVDIFSVGAVFYELLAFRRPFDGDSITATILKILQAEPEPLENIDPSTDPALAALVMKCLAKDPADRFQTVDELLPELKQFASSLPPAPQEDYGSSVDTVRSWSGEVLEAPTIETPAGLPVSSGSAKIRSAPVASGPVQAAQSPAGASRQPGAPVISEPPIHRPHRGALLGAAAACLLLVFSSVLWVKRAPHTTYENKASIQPGSTSAAHGTSPGSTGKVNSTARPDSVAEKLTAPAPVPPPPKTVQDSAKGPAAQSATNETPKAPREAGDAKAVQAQLDAAAQRTAAEALQQMARARAKADTAGASQYAAKSYEAAHRIELEARALYDSGRYQQAGVRLYQATGLYGSAALEAESEKESRSRMEQARLEEQQRRVALSKSQAEVARQAFAQASRAAEDAGAGQRSAAAFDEASRLASRAQSAFDQQDYPGAKSQWDAASAAMERTRISAAELARASAAVRTEPAPPDTSPKAPAPASPEGERQLIVSALEKYTDALRAKDLAALKTVWPGISPKQESALREEFRNARQIAVQLSDLKIEPAGDAATVTARRMYTLQTNDGQKLEKPSRIIVTLRKAAGSWILDRISFESPR